jgi:hypothetical protein
LGAGFLSPFFAPAPAAAAASCAPGRSRPLDAKVLARRGDRPGRKGERPGRERRLESGFIPAPRPAPRPARIPSASGLFPIAGRGGISAGFGDGAAPGVGFGRDISPTSGIYKLTPAIQLMRLRLNESSINNATNNVKFWMKGRGDETKTAGISAAPESDLLPRFLFDLPLGAQFPIMQHDICFKC